MQLRSFGCDYCRNIEPQLPRSWKERRKTWLDRKIFPFGACRVFTRVFSDRRDRRSEWRDNLRSFDVERHEVLRLELRTRYESLFAYKTRVQLGRGEGSFHCKASSIDSTPRKHNKMISSRLYRCQRPFNGVLKTRSSGKESRLHASFVLSIVPYFLPLAAFYPRAWALAAFYSQTSGDNYPTVAFVVVFHCYFW